MTERCIAKSGPTYWVLHKIVTRTSARIFLSFPRACLARARNPEFRWRTWGRTGILRAAATRENDRARDRARNCHYDLQSSIVVVLLGCRRIKLDKHGKRYGMRSLRF